MVELKLSLGKGSPVSFFFNLCSKIIMAAALQSVSLIITQQEKKHFPNLSLPRGSEIFPQAHLPCLPPCDPESFCSASGNAKEKKSKDKAKERNNTKTPVERMCFPRAAACPDKHTSWHQH